MKDAPHVPDRSVLSASALGRLYEQAWYEVYAQTARASLPAADLVYVNNTLVAAPLSEALLKQIERQAGELARERLLQRSKRGAVSDFSRRSRGRLLRFVARLDPAASGLFLTLTYRQNMRDHVLAKEHLDKLLRWLKYNYQGGAFLWRMEYQRRGAIHFHVLCFGVAFIEAQKITDYWQALTGDDSYPDLSEIQSRRKATYYVSKYIAKVPPATDGIPNFFFALAARSLRLALALGLLAANGFILVPYSEKRPFVGRFWGCVNRQNLPYAPLHVRRVIGAADVLHEFRRYARRYWKGTSKRLQGFSLFVGSSDQWLRCFEALIADSWLPHEVRNPLKLIDF